jgi:surface protein
MKKLFTLLTLLLGVVQSTFAQEPYAVLSDDNTTLTFYYDNNKETNNGMDVGPFTYGYYNNGTYLYEVNSGWYKQRENITTVVFDDSFANCTSITSTAYWFYNCSYLATITGLKNLNTANVTDMTRMFSGCQSIGNLDVSNFTTENVTSMWGMFDFCMSLKSLDVSNFNTAKVTNMAYMFYTCWQLKELDLSNFNTANVSTMYSMFNGCWSLETIYCNDAWSCDYSPDMFKECKSLKGDISYDASKTDVTYAKPVGGYFTPIAKEPYAVLDTDERTLTFYYDNNKEANGGMDVGPFVLSAELIEDGLLITVNSEWHLLRHYIEKVVFKSSFANCTSITSTAYWFYDCSNLATITGLKNLNTANVTDMTDMFEECSSLTSLDLSSFNTSKVRNMSGMFSWCSNLTNLNLSNFNTANVTDMNSMFSYCTSLTSIDVSNFNTVNVTNMSGMFSGCSSLKSLDVSKFNTANVTNMLGMFSGCSSLTSLDVSNFNTANVANMAALFSGCSSLINLDVSKFNTANVTYMYNMFKGCSSLKTLYCNDTWNCDDSQDMFKDCTSLKGAINYDPEKTDVTYANPTTGYFTKKAVAVIPGDANGDGYITDADVVVVKEHIMGNEPDGFVFEGADANEDGKVNVADIVEIINKKE